MELTTLDRIKDEAEEEAVRRLLIRKQNLIAEIEHIQNMESSNVEDSTELVQLELTHDKESVVLSITLEGNRTIHAMIIFAEGLFPNGESHALQFSQPKSSAQMPLPVQRHLAIDLHINLLVNLSQNDILKVIEIVHPLPTFSRFKQVPWPKSTKNILSTQFRVTARIQERIQRVIVLLISLMLVLHLFKILAVFLFR